MKKRPPHVKESGYVYVLSNASMPGLLKIGMTHRTPQERLRELNASTGVLPFTLEAFVTSTDVRFAEKEIHRRLAGRRVSDRREFFNVGLPEALTVVRTVARMQGSRLALKGGSGAAAKVSGAVMMAMTVAAAACWLDPRLAAAWLALAGWTSISGRPKEVREFLRLADSLPVWMSALGSACLAMVAIAPVAGAAIAARTAAVLAG